MILQNETTGLLIVRRVTLQTTLTGRFFGAMGRRVAQEEAIGIASCNWVHTFFVSGALDLIFCDDSGKVLRVVHSLEPFRFSPYVQGATVVYELSGGSIQTSVDVGNVLRLVN